MQSETQLAPLVEAVQANRKYAHIAPALVRRLSAEALEKGLSRKAAVKDVRNKLHQVGGAYFRSTPDYAIIGETLLSLPVDLQSDEVKGFCRSQMRSHASTAERLPILETFFQTCLAHIAPVTSVLDLACGLNPLAIPWMPLAEGAEYYACDIYLDMLALIQSFFTHAEVNGKAEPCDLVKRPPSQQAQVALLLKAIPCLEQVDKGIGLPLLESIQAEHILVSFPVRSLGGRQKGMPEFYRAHFTDLVAEKNWQIREFNFDTELAFLVSK